MSGACCPAAACFRARSVQAMANPPPEASPETAKVGGKNPRLPATGVTTHTPHVWWACHYKRHHSATLKPSMTTSVTLLVHPFFISSHICTGLCLPDSQVPSLFFALTRCKISLVKETLSRNAIQFCSLLYVVIRFTALKCKLCFDRARYRKGHQAVGATCRIRYWNRLKQLETMAAHGMITTRRLGLSWPFASRNFRMSAVVTSSAHKVPSPCGAHQINSDAIQIISYPKNQIVWYSKCEILY